MVGIVRGGIYWANLNPVLGHEPRRRRPVVVISHSAYNDSSETMIILAITSRPQRLGYPLSWQIPGGIDGRPSWVKIGQIRTVSIERFGTQIGSIDHRAVRLLVDAFLQFVD